MSLDKLKLNKLGRQLNDIVPKVNQAITMDTNVAITDAKGTYPTLKAKFDSITGMVENNATMSVTASRLTSLTSAVDGVGQLKSVDGMTIKNLVKNGGFDTDVSGWDDVGYGSISCVNGQLEYTTITPTASARIETPFNPVASNKYYIRYDLKLPKTSGTKTFLGDGWSDAFIVTANNNVNISMISTPSSSSTPFRIYFDVNSVLAVGDKVYIDNVSLVNLTELGLADKDKAWCDENLVFVNGLVSVLPTGVKVTGKNKFDQSRQDYVVSGANYAKLDNGFNVKNTISTSYAKIRFLLTLKPNTTYTLSTNVNRKQGTSGGAIICTDDAGAYSINSSTSYPTMSFSFTTPQNGKVILHFYSAYSVVEISEVEFTNIMLVEGTSSATYETYKESLTTIPTLVEGLRRLPNGVKDTIDVVNGKVKRNVGKVVFNGSEEWNINNTLTNSIEFYTPVNNSKTGGGAMSDKFGSVFDFNLEYVRCSGSANFIVINILKSKLSSQDVAGFKAWLNANNTTVLYELATPTEQNIVIDNALQSYPSGTISVDGNIPCNVTYTYPSNIASAVKAISDVVDDLSNTVAKKKQEDWITPTLLNGATGDIKYRKNEFGRVEFKGTITVQNTSVASFVLPTSYRPSSTFGIPAYHNNGVGSVVVNQMGEFKVGQTYLTYVDYISFPI